MTLPTGTVSLLLGDVEGSTRLWESDTGCASAAIARLDELSGVLAVRLQRRLLQLLSRP